MAGLLLALACQNRDARQPADLSSHASIEAMSAVAFDGARATEDLERLEALDAAGGPDRNPGKARALIRRAVKRAGFEVEYVETPLALDASVTGAQVEPQTLTHVVARREGGSTDVILLVAPYDTPAPPALGPSASGASVLVELARLDEAVRDAIGDQPFTLVLAFVEGDALGDEASRDDPRRAYPGTAAFARGWLEAHPGEDVRLAVWIDRVGAPQVEIARDLHSNRAYRETFFSVGEQRELQPTFIAARPLSAPPGGHLALQAEGFSPVVALIGEPTPATLAGAPRGAAAGAPRLASPTSLAAVGEATWWGIVEISDRLARIDAFRVDPLGGGPGSLELPGANEPIRPNSTGEAADAVEPGPSASASDDAPASPR